MPNPNPNFKTKSKPSNRLIKSGSESEDRPRCPHFPQTSSLCRLEVHTGPHKGTSPHIHPHCSLWVSTLCNIVRFLFWPRSLRTLTVKWDNDCEVKSSRCQLWALEGIFRCIKWTVKEPQTLLCSCQKYLSRLRLDPVITICRPFLSNAACKLLWSKKGENVSE